MSSNESGRTLGSLIARFTADRDALLAAVQGCQERVAELVARVEAGGAESTGSTAAIVPTVIPVQLQELRGLVEQLRDEQGSAVSEAARSTGECLTRMDDLGSFAQRAQKGIDEVRDAVELLRAQLARVENGVEARLTDVSARVEHDTQAALAPVKVTVDALERERSALRESLAALSTRIGRAEGAGDAVKASLAPQLTRLESAVTRLDGAETALQKELTAVRGVADESRRMADEVVRRADEMGAAAVEGRRASDETRRAMGTLATNERVASLEASIGRLERELMRVVRAQTAASQQSVAVPEAPFTWIWSLAHDVVSEVQAVIQRLRSFVSL